MIEVDCILVPYGDEFSQWSVPYEESVRFGLNRSEYEQWCKDVKLNESRSKDPFLGPNLEVTHGTQVLDLPPFVKAKDNYASVQFRGAHDRISLIASGFSHPKYPMLWEDEAWLDPQVKGHDGIQSFANRDGTYGFVFAPQARTTRVSGKWGSASHTFHVTQALSASDIQEISSLNGRVKITQARTGRIELVSPRLWCPASHTWLDRSLNTMTSQARTVETVPITFKRDTGPQAMTLEAYGPNAIQMAVTSKETLVMTVSGLYPETTYGVTMGDHPTEAKTDRQGDLKLTLTGKAGPIPIRIQTLPQGDSL